MTCLIRVFIADSTAVDKQIYMQLTQNVTKEFADYLFVWMKTKKTSVY